MKEVLITINSTQSLDGDSSAGPELITQGDYEYASDGARFSYMESELTGLTGTKTSFYIKPDEVVLSRRGTVNAQMVFRRGERTNFGYRTAHGTLNVGLETRDFGITLDEHGGDIEIDYVLNFEQSFVSCNKFRINIRERDLKV